MKSPEASYYSQPSRQRSGDDQTRRSSAIVALARRDGLGFVVLTFALLTRLLLAPPIWQHGEAREGLVVHGIVHNHEWLLPFRNGEIPSKPPFFHWLAALPAFVLGPNDFIVRLPSALAAAIMAAATFFIGREMGGRRIGWLAVGALLGMHEFWSSASQARVDMVFAASITVALAGFFFWYRDSNQAARITCYIASACAMLAKGPAGLVLPGVTIVAFLVVEGRLGSLWTFWSWPLTAVLLVVDLGWYASAYFVGGNEFLTRQLVVENLDRFLGQGRFSTQHTSISVLAWLATYTLPWNLALLWGLIRWIRGSRQDWTGRFLHAWWISITIVFMLAARSRAVYLLPLYPAIALLAARAISDAIPVFAGPSVIGSVDKDQPPWWRSRKIVSRAGIAVGVFNLTLMLSVPPTYWTNRRPRNTRLAFIENIRATVSPGNRLFFASDFDTTDAMVIAYRLGREIARKPLICAVSDDYFLIRSDATNVPGVKTQILASSKTDEISLVRVTSASALPENLACIR